MSPDDGAGAEKADILLVDDQPEGLMALEATLASLGQTLHRATSGREALRLLLQRDFAVVLLDVIMPELDGFETARLIRARERSSRTPIIFLTALNQGELPRLRAYGMGAVDYLIKPYEADVLRAKVSVFVDLARKTSLVRAQAAELAELERRAHQQQLAQAREEFLAVALHELRSPLNALSLQLQIGLRRWGDKGGQPVPAEEVCAAFARLERSVKRLNRTGDYLLDVASIHNGFELAREAVDLGQLTREVISRLTAELDVPEGLISIDANEVIGWWDRRRLELVVGNLVSNAIKYGEGKPVDVVVRHEEQGAMLVVRDRGPGIDPALQSKIFERFVRAAPPSHTRPSGFGLGLWIVREIVSRHGGKVGVQSALGAGASFTVVLPREPDRVLPAA